MFACNGILFNHESPRRGETFVTRKITREVAKIPSGPVAVPRVGQSGLEARLGTRQRLRRGHVVDAATSHPRGLRHCVRRDAQREGIRPSGIPARREGDSLGGVGSGRSGEGERHRNRPGEGEPPDIFDRRKWIFCWGIPPRPGRSSIGRRKCPSRNW
jgi:hypothetical protein